MGIVPELPDFEKLSIKVGELVCNDKRRLAPMPPETHHAAKYPVDQ
jgi:hypothetical protein